MTERLKGKSIAITGAGRGIGRELALQFAAEGARIVVADFGGSSEGVDASKAPADSVVAEIQERGGEAVAVYDDVSTFAGGENVVQAAVDNFGKIDGLVCNAGIMGPVKPLLELSEDEFDRVVRVNMRGQFCPVRAAIPHMREQGHGRLIYFSSSAALVADHGAVNQDETTLYSSSKSGVFGMMWSTATHFSQYGITSNAIMPGAATRLIDVRLPDTEEAAAFLSDHARTWLDPKHVAPLVAYLLSEAGATVNGQIFGTVGGRLAHYRPIEPGNVINAKEGVGFSMDELFRRFPEEFGTDINFEPAAFPPPITK